MFKFLKKLFKIKKQEVIPVGPQPTMELESTTTTEGNDYLVIEAPELQSPVMIPSVWIPQEVGVYNRAGELVRTYSLEVHGENYRELAFQFLEQDINEHIGWYIK